MNNNPFTPTFGTVPYYLAGREKILTDMSTVFENWKGNPNTTSILVGPRGSGKTAMLTAIGDIARKQGWIVIDVSAYEGMLEDIYEKIIYQAEEVLPDRNKRVLKQIRIKDFGIEFEQNSARDQSLSWRVRIERLFECLQEVAVGVLITVDEVLPKLEEMIELASEYQIIQRRGSKISLLMAGLPKNINDLTDDKSVSFLRRARRITLGRIDDREAEKAIINTMAIGNKTISKEPLTKAVEVSNGFPYMIQLAGYYIFEEAAQKKRITMEMAEKGISEARSDFRNGVLYNTFAELSDNDKQFLYAMLEDKCDSRLTDIADRMKKTNGYAYTYKIRLMQAGVIDETNKKLNFSLPFFREYLIEQKQYE